MLEAAWIRKLSGRKSFIGNGTGFGNVARLNKESVKRFQEWHRMRKPF